MKITVLLFAFMVSVTAQAQNLIVGQPVYGGSGCPAGSAEMTMSPDQQEFVLAPSRFRAQSGPRAGKRMDRKACAVTIPVQVPQGYQVALTTETIGSVVVGSRAQASFTEELFSAGMRGPLIAKKFRNQTDSEIHVDTDSEIFESQYGWSMCGASANLRANLSLATQGEAFASIDEIHFKLIWKACR
jgi:hypothetical protein